MKNNFGYARNMLKVSINSELTIHTSVLSPERSIFSKNLINAECDIITARAVCLKFKPVNFSDQTR